MFFELLPKCRGRIQCTSGRPMYTDSAMVPWRPRGVGGLQRLSTFLFLAFFFWLVTPQKRDSIDGAEHHGDKTETEVKEMSVLREQLNSTRLQSVIKLKVNSDFFLRCSHSCPAAWWSVLTSDPQSSARLAPPGSHHLRKKEGNMVHLWATWTKQWKILPPGGRGRAIGSKMQKKKYPEDKQKPLIRQ